MFALLLLFWSVLHPEFSLEFLVFYFDERLSFYEKRKSNNDGNFKITAHDVCSEHSQSILTSCEIEKQVL